MKYETVGFSEKEMGLIRQVAEQRGMTEEEAATALFSEGLERRVRRRTGRGPARNILKMRRR